MENNQDLTNRIVTWIEQQGYPLEMTVAKALQHRGFQVIQSDYYRDSESGDSREIDVNAYLQTEVEDVLLRISMIVECKLSKDKPWLMFTSDTTRIHQRARVVQRVATESGMLLLRMLSLGEDIQNLPIFASVKHVGYGVTQAFTQGHDVCYAAATSVAKATLSEALEANQAAKLTHRPICSVLFPVIVIDGRLFKASLEENGSLSVSEIDSATLIWRNQLVKEPHTIIDIVTKEHFEQYCSSFHSSAQSIFEACRNGRATDVFIQMHHSLE